MNPFWGYWDYEAAEEPESREAPKGVIGGTEKHGFWCQVCRSEGRYEWVEYPKYKCPKHGEQSQKKWGGNETSPKNTKNEAGRGS